MVVAIVVVVGLVLLALLALVVRGAMSGSAELPFGIKFKVKAKGRPADTPPAPGSASIEGSKSGRDATAIGPGGARIKKVRARRDLTARAEDPPNPKA
jgi:hypothetical protein